MNADRLLANYDRIADAADAIPRLRAFILDLAVRGKLVPDDPKDGPAFDFDGGIPNDLEAPFEIPKHWKWARLHTLGSLRGGGTPSKAHEEYWNGPIPWISPKDMKVDYLAGGQLTISETAIANSATSLIEPGSILFVVRGMILAHSFPVALTRVPLAINQDMKALVLKKREMAEFILRVLKGLKTQILKRVGRSSHGTCRLEGSDYRDFLVPVPPVAEQHRIVAKVDELMALCDRLEVARAEREATRERLTAATFKRLNDPDPDPRVFSGDARFALANTTHLTTRSDQVKQLRRTILNLAVRGKLVPQDPNDVPASLLLKQLATEIEVYVREGGRGSIKPEPVEADDAPFPAPVGWAWARLCALFRVITDGDHQPPPKSDEGVPFLTIANITTGVLDFSECRFVPPSYFQSLAAYRTPQRGDILYSVVGATYGRPALVDTDRGFCVQRHIAILKPTASMNVAFLMRLMASPLVYDQASRAITGTAQPTIALRPLRNFLVPLPPLAEQRRIVAKVDELMALCDRLEATLAVVGDARRRLLDVLLAEALAPTKAPAMTELAKVAAYA